MADIDSSVDILMVEDNANDEALTLHELRKYHLTNRIQVVRDGQEALEYIFCTGRYATARYQGPAPRDPARYQAALCRWAGDPTAQSNRMNGRELSRS